MADYTTIQQYAPLRLPATWGAEEKKFLVQLTDILDDIYRRYGRLKITDMGTILRAKIENIDVVDGRTVNNESAIAQLADSIVLRVTQTIFDSAMADKADTADVDARFESVVSQTAQEILQTFTTLQGNVDTVSGEFDSYREQLSAYIRTSISGMEMGRSDSPFTMTLSNTQLSFLQSAIVLAYFANNKLYVTEIETEKAIIAGYEWAETTGGTGLKWVG
jgi:hypothetical protein